MKKLQDKIKKLWRKFKRLLIKKLGGYTDETHIIRKHVYSYSDAVCLEWDKVIPINQYNSDPVFKKYIDQTLIDELSECLYKNRDDLMDLYFDSSKQAVGYENHPERMVTMRARVFVYPTHRKLTTD